MDDKAAARYYSDDDKIEARKGRKEAGSRKAGGRKEASPGKGREAKRVQRESPPAAEARWEMQ